MAEILFVTWDGGGNVPPASGLASELRRRGHDVRLLGHPGNAAAAACAGVPFEPFVTARLFRGTDDNSDATMLATFADRDMGRDVLAALSRRPADLVVVDCLLFGVMDVLARAGVRYVVLEHFFNAYLTRQLRGMMGLGLLLHRVRARHLLENADLRLAATLAELDPARRRDPANLVRSGPVVAGRPSALDGSTVLVSLSTFGFPGMGEALQRILDAVADVPARVVVTTGPVIEPSTLRAPGNAELHRFVPHEDLLPEVSLVVGHGGHATTMAALAHGIPLVVMPMHARLDQPMVGRSVQEAGAGRLLHKESDPAEIRAAVTDLLGPGPHREAAARLAAAIRTADGPSTGADLLERRLSSNARRG